MLALEIAVLVRREHTLGCMVGNPRCGGFVTVSVTVCILLQFATSRNQRSLDILNAM